MSLLFQSFPVSFQHPHPQNLPPTIFQNDPSPPEIAPIPAHTKLIPPIAGDHLGDKKGVLRMEICPGDMGEMDNWHMYVYLFIYIYNFFNGSILWAMTMGIFYRMRHDFMRYHDMEYGWIFHGDQGELLELSQESPWGPPNYGNVEREMYNKPSIFGVFLPNNPCLHWVYTCFWYIDCYFFFSTFNQC